MTTPISLKSTRLDILLEVTEDRGIESGGWDLERQITLPSRRGSVQISGRRERGWGSRKSVSLSLFLSSYALSVPKRSVRSEGTKGSEWRLHRECQESGERSTNPSTSTFQIPIPHSRSPFHIPHSRRQESMEVSSIEVLLACLGSQHFYSTKCEMLANLTAKNSDYRP